MEGLTGSEKIASIKVPKDVEAIDNDEEAGPERAPNRQPGLQRVPVDQLEGRQYNGGRDRDKQTGLLSVHALNLHSTVSREVSCPTGSTRN